MPKSLALAIFGADRLFRRPADRISRARERVFRQSINRVEQSGAQNLWRQGQAESASFISVDEVKSLIREGAAKGIFNETEKELIHSVFEFTDTPVKAVMVPRTEIHAIEVHASFAEVAKASSKAAFRASRFTKANWIR